MIDITELGELIFDYEKSLDNERHDEQWPYLVQFFNWTKKRQELKEELRKLATWEPLTLS